QDRPKVTPLPTKIEVKDRRINFTTGKASVVLDGTNITFEAEGNISVKAKGGDLVIDGKPVYINTKKPPAAPRPAPLPPLDPGTFHAKATDPETELAQQAEPPPPQRP